MNNSPAAQSRKVNRRLRRRTRIRTMLALSPWVLGSIGLTVGLLWLFRAEVPPSALVATNDMIGNALQTLGTVYAVLLAFVVFVVWGQFNEARAAVENEANSIGDLYRVLAGLSPPTRDSARRKLLAYLDEVLGDEWAAMACLDEHTTAALSADLELVWDELRQARPADELQHTYLTEALNRFNDLSDARSVRLSTARMRMPFALRALLYLGAAMTVGLMFCQGVESFTLHALAAGSLAGAIAHVIYVIEDLDDAFSGDWQVPREPFERLREHLDGA